MAGQAPVHPGSSDPQVVRRRIDMGGGRKEAAEEAEYWTRVVEAQRRAEARTAAWRALIAEQEAADLAGHAADLRADIDRSELAVLAARAALLEKVGHFLPAGFAGDWAAARTAIELLGPVPESGARAPVPLDVQDFVRPPLLAFYWGLRAWEVKRYQDAVAASRNRMLIWKMNQLPVAGSRYADRRPPADALPPKPPTFEVRKRRGAVELAQSSAQWDDVVRDFEQSTSLIDTWVMEMVAADSPERQALEYTIGLHRRQAELFERQPQAEKIEAMFYPKDETRTEEGKQRAVGYPWFFYLYRDSTTGTWKLEDLTADKRVNIHEPTLVEALESYLRARHQLPEPKDPPVELWEQLDSKLRFPKGELHLKLPSGKVYTQVTTAKRTWSEYLGIAAMAAGLIALTLFTAGAGTAAGVAVIASAGLGITSAAVGLAELEKHGMATGTDRATAALMIAVELASAFSFGLGRIGAAAARAGPLASNAARLAGRVFVPVAKLSVGLEVTQLFVMTAQFVHQFQAIESDPKLTPEQRSKAKERLVLVGLATGALLLWSIRSTMQDIRTSRLVQADELIPGLASAVPRRRMLGPPAPAEAPAARTLDLRLGAAVMTGRELRPDLAPGTISVELRRNRVGLISEIGIVHGPPPAGRAARAWEADLAAHEAIAAIARQYSGLIGELRELLARLAATLTGRQRGPIERQLELAKLEGRIEDRLRRLQQANRLTPQERLRYQRDIESFTNQIEHHRQAILRGDPRPARIMQQGTPDGYPAAPPGHSYHYDTVAQTWDIRPDQHTTGARFRLERDSTTGLPTGRFTNAQQLEDLKVVGLAVNDPATVERLESLGYAFDAAQMRIFRPPQYSGPSNLPQMVPLRVVDGKVAITPQVHLDARTLGNARYYRKYYGSSLDAEDMAARHGGGGTSETGWFQVAPAIARGGDETLLRLGSRYGLKDYVRYHIVGPGVGVERTRIFLAPEAANKFANHEIEGFMRRLLKANHKVEFRAVYTTFSGRELRSFIDGMLTSGDQRLLRILVRDNGRFERLLKEVSYEIRVVDKNGVERMYHAAIAVGLPGSGTVTKQAPTLVVPSQ